MGFFSDVVDTVTSIPGRVVDVATSGLLGPGIAMGASVLSGDTFSESLASGTGAMGIGGMTGPAGSAGSAVRQMNGTDALASGVVNPINLTLGQLLSVNGIMSAPTGNIKATMVLTLTPQGFAFVDSVRRGTPAVMSRDLQITKKTIKAIGKMSRRIPKKTVQPSVNAQINNRVKQKILSDIDCNNPLRIATGGSHCG